MQEGYWETLHSFLDSVIGPDWPCTVPFHDFSIFSINLDFPFTTPTTFFGLPPVSIHDFSIRINLDFPFMTTTSCYNAIPTTFFGSAPCTIHISSLMILPLLHRFVETSILGLSGAGGRLWGSAFSTSDPTTTVTFYECFGLIHFLSNFCSLPK